MSKKTVHYLASLLVCLVLLASACSSGSDDTTIGFGPTTTDPITKPEAATSEPITPTPASTSAPPTAVPSATTEPSAIELVEATIQEIGVAVVVPAGWSEVADGTYQGPDGQLAIGGFPAWAAPDLSSVGLVPIETLSIGDHEWQLQALETDEFVIMLATTNVGESSFVVQLISPPDMASEYADSIGSPALEAFEIIDPGAIDDSMTFELVTMGGRDVAFASNSSAPTAGVPTVVFESGLGDGMAVWADVAPSVAQFANVFVYDRPGYGRSTPAETPRDATTIVAELRDTLRTSGHLPPYVLVGHSLGGTVMDLFARTHPEEVVGLVLVDSRHHDFTDRCVAELAAEGGCVPPPEIVETFAPHARDEWQHYVDTEAQLRVAPAPSADLALTVITAGIADAESSVQEWELWQQTQLDYVSSVPSSTHVVAVGSDHQIPARSPELIVNAIADVFGVSTVTPAVPEPGASTALQTIATDLVNTSDLPAVGITVFDQDQIVETAVAGVRREGDPTLAELDDKFSIGSNAKAMTATLVATFVDEGVLSWDTTVSDVFGDSLPEIHRDHESVTLRQLLSHTAGINDEADSSWTNPILAAGLGLEEQRHQLATIALARPQDHEGGRYMYSNVGYTIVGAMLEHISDSPWETLMRTRIFDPLGMSSCGFMAPGTPGTVDQPWGHLAEDVGRAIDPGDVESDYPAGIAPAGLVHCSMSDWARFLQSQLRGFSASTDELVSPSAFEAMQTAPSGSNYALGWVREQVPNGHVVLYHNGSNERFTAEVWLIPEEEIGLLMVTNLGETLANPTLVDAGQALLASRPTQ